MTAPSLVSRGRQGSEQRDGQADQSADQGKRGSERRAEQGDQHDGCDDNADDLARSERVRHTLHEFVGDSHVDAHDLCAVGYGHRVLLNRGRHEEGVVGELHRRERRRAVLGDESDVRRQLGDRRPGIELRLDGERVRGGLDPRKLSEVSQQRADLSLLRVCERHVVCRGEYERTTSSADVGKFVGELRGHLLGRSADQPDATRLDTINPVVVEAASNLTRRHSRGPRSERAVIVGYCM